MAFNAYAAYYNLLYAEKDYTAEAIYVDALVKKHTGNKTYLLDVGCGTGKHAAELAKMGYMVTGVDLSQEMIDTARKSLIDTNAIFQEGDIRTFELERKFDVVVSLFHVMSYQISDRDLQLAFQQVHKHLVAGGLFIFDCWYGPGVMTDPPARRERAMQNELVHVKRFAEPLHDELKHTVNVHYKVEVTELETKKVTTIDEDHLMRYLFTEEVEQLASKSGFRLLDAHPWMRHKKLDNAMCWNAVFILKKPK